MIRRPSGVPIEPPPAPPADPGQILDRSTRTKTRCGAVRSRHRDDHPACSVVYSVLLRRLPRPRRRPAVRRRGMVPVPRTNPRPAPGLIARRRIEGTDPRHPRRSCPRFRRPHHRQECRDRRPAEPVLAETIGPPRPGDPARTRGLPGTDQDQGLKCVRADRQGQGGPGGGFPKNLPMPAQTSGRGSASVRYKTRR